MAIQACPALKVMSTDFVRFTFAEHRAFGDVDD